MIRKIIAAFVKRWGSPRARQSVWNSEYQTGKWTYDRNGQNNEAQEPIYKFLHKYGESGSILDLGCGSGMTALEMKNTFRCYTGVDVSDVAIEKARSAISDEPDRTKKVQFFVSDISTFVPNGRFSVILFRESIYYVPQLRIKGMLARYCSHLLPEGVFLVRICDRDRFRKIIDLLETELQVIETYEVNDSKMSLFVCSPR